MLQAVVAMCALAGPATTLAQDASATSAQEKLLKERVIRALTSKDTRTLFMLMDQYRDLAASGAQIPAGLFFAEADAARSSGDPVRAERAFNDFFNVASPEGAAFTEAMRAYGDFRASLAETTWPLLEAMTPITVEAPSADDPKQGIAPFSIGDNPVTRRQFAEFVAATGYQPSPPADADAPGCRVESDAAQSAAPAAEAAATVMPAPDETAAVMPAPGEAATVIPAPDEAATVATAAATTASADDPMTCVSWNDATAYVDWLRNSTGVGFRLPRAAELEHAARKSAVKGPTQTIPPREWVADCASTGSAQETVGTATDADRDGCDQRLLLVTSATPAETSEKAKAREPHPSRHRAPDLCFRLAL
jgi:formylglycine-generating enzyme required for sulfatase activity